MTNPINSLCQEHTFSKVFRSYSTTLFNYLYYKSGDENQAQDLVQDAFMKLWQNCSSVSLDTAKGYVFKTANNKMLNLYQHNKVKLKFKNLDHKGHTNESPEFLMLEKEQFQQINKAIDDLPEKQRTVFLLSRIDKKTYREIAEIIGISKQGVEKRIYLALDTLRKVNKRIK